MGQNSVLLIGADNLAERVEAYKRLLPTESIAILRPDGATAGRNTFLGVPVAHEWPEASGGIADIAGDLTARAVTARRALENGQQALIHPPFGDSYANAEAILAAAGGAIRVALPVHYTHKYETAAQSARSGIGDTITVRAIRVFPPAQAWRQSMFQLVESLVLLGGPLQRIYAKAAALKSSDTDTVFCNGRYASRAIFYGEMSAAYPGNYSKEVIEVTGRDGMVEYDSNARSYWLASESGITLTEAYHRSPYEKMADAYLRSWEAGDESTPRLPDPLPALRAYWAAMESIKRNEVVDV
jgi:predicted dehydrogenase